MKKFRIGSLLLAILLLCTVFVSTVSAQDNLTTSVKPSELEQGLIDALNSNTKNLATDDVIANYCNANKDKISILEDNNVSGKSNSRMYQLEDGSSITFYKSR